MPKPKTFTTVSEFMHSAWGPRDVQKTDEHRAVYDAVGARLSKLHAAAHGAVGQLVLVIKRTVETHGCSMGMPARLLWPQVEESLRLGMLVEPGLTMTVDKNGLVTDTLTCELTVPQFVRAWQGSGRWCTRVDAGPIRDDVLASFWMHLDTPLKGAERGIGGPVKHLEVIAGDEAVFTWSVRQHHELLLRALARLLGREVSFPALTKRVDYERRTLAEAVEKLWAERITLRRGIDAVTDAGKHGAGVISRDGVSITLCENEDDAFWITAGDRDRLKAVESNLREHLGRLVALGIDDATPNIHIIRHAAQQLGVVLS